MDFGHMLDVAIGLSLMYLILSLFCTIINEYIASVLKLRAKGLEKGLTALSAGTPFMTALLAHPLLAAAAPKGKAALQATKTALDNARADLARHQQTLAEAQQRQPAPGITELEYLENVVKQAQRVVDTLAQAVAPATPPSGDRASYLSGQTFVSALLDMVNPTIQTSDTATYKAILSGIDTIPDDRVRASLRAIVNNTSASLQSTRDALAHWFDSEMAHLQGAYKRQIQMVALAVALAVAAAANADTLAVARALWTDRGLSSRMADIAGQMIQGDQNTPASQSLNALVGADRAVAEKRQALDTAKTALTQGKGDQAAVDAAQAALDNAEDARSTTALGAAQDMGSLRQALAPLPIGWTTTTPPFSLPQFLGWCLTALALSLGSSFWFDLLTRFINIRGAGNRPQAPAVKPADPEG